MFCVKALYHIYVNIESWFEVIAVEIPNSITSIGESAFEQCTSLVSVEIPNSVTSIGKYAFAKCSSLLSAKLPNSITKISNHLFSGCTSLQAIEIPTSVTSLEDSSFSECSSLTTVVIPDLVTSLGRSAFNSCTSLQTVWIPRSVSVIGEYGFAWCTSLKKITSLNTTPPYVFPSTFGMVPTSECTLIVPGEALEAYKKAYEWRDFFNVKDIESTTGLDCTMVLFEKGKAFNLQGQNISDGYKGVVIQNGKKFIRK